MERSERFALQDLHDFTHAAFLAIGASEETADAASRSMMHGTTLGVDSHGVRLLPHYLKALQGGRLNRTPQLRTIGSFGAVEVLDGDNAQGALPTFRAMDRAMELAGSFGLGAVSIRNSSHFGPAGAYSLAAARQGFIGVTFCNSDSFVRLHDGAMRFHGTNPIAVSVPVGKGDPWLLDMATSAIPYNRVQLYQSLGVDLPPGVASDAQGVDTGDPHKADMLAPLGGAFGFKGAALAGVAEIFSAVLSGMTLSFDIPPMGGPDFSTPRAMGAFVLALNPDAFLDRAQFDAGMRRYVETLRSSPVREGCCVMAPGDREWQVAAQRQEEGVTLDPATLSGFSEWARTLGIPMVTPKESR
ncbi:Ldh family oxidoreductase [Falsirhodobacter deserti]|uniref:Ldh family oxidoreductase n=1 Tax=Falsirhodobacter deserti TaxID=1365611 RepID=UPI000FE3DE79|nr:Ldh family oxidoreductase [Falsirhodobacter deserti]